MSEYASTRAQARAVGLGLSMGLLLLTAACTPAAAPATPTPVPVGPTVLPTRPPTVVPTVPTETPWIPPLVFEVEGNLWAYDGTAVRALVEDGRSGRPLLSPDGRRLWFERHEPPTEISTDPFSVWILDLPTGQERQVDLSVIPPYRMPLSEEEYLEVPRWPSGAVWMPDGGGVLFTTAVEYTGMGPGGWVTNDDIWLADAETGRMTNLFEGEGVEAAFSVNPDGEWVLLSYPERIASLRLASGERRTLVEFPMVITYSEYYLLPQPRWLPGGLQAHVAIAPNDPMQSQVFTLWRLDVEAGEAQEIGEVVGSVFGWSPTGLSWSPDGAWLAYVEGGLRVMLANVDTGEALEVAQGETPYVLGWSPDGRLFLYQDGRVVYGVEAGPSPQVLRLAEPEAWRGFPLWWEGQLFIVVEGRLLRVATDGSGVVEIGP